MKNKSISLGIIAAVSPIPMVVLTALWCWAWVFGVGMGLLHYEILPEWILLVSILPLLISPLLSIVGAVHGIANIRGRPSWVGVFLSIIGLAENLVLIYGMYYLGSRF